MSIIFEFNSHYSYLEKRLSGADNWGQKAKFAEHIGVQPAYLSQVLAQKYSLSLEQADLANEYLEHSTEESEFFILLVLKDRAGRVSLRKHFAHQISQILEKRKLLTERLGKKVEISEEVKGVYYSSWLYSAIHVACSVPALRTRKSLVQYFNISTELASKILDYLEENYLLKKEGDQYVLTGNWFRLGQESPHIIKHHTNWRLQAIQSLESQTNADLHYSGIFSLDKKTAELVKSQLLDSIKQQTKNIESAPEEELFVMSVDFFRR